MNPQRRKERVALLSVTSNSVLVVMKLVVGLTIGSVAIVSEAIHSAVDWLAAVIALFSVKTSSLPADEKHPFGHGKIENISGTVEALLEGANPALVISNPAWVSIVPGTATREGIPSPSPATFTPASS